MFHYELCGGHYASEYVPSLTVALLKKCSDHWLVQEVGGAPLTPTELCRLQGVDPALAAHADEEVLGKLLADAITVPVLARVLQGLLLSSGLARLTSALPAPSGVSTKFLAG